MSIRVEGAGGEVFEFPDGTAQDVMRSALQKHYARATADRNDPNQRSGESNEQYWQRRLSGQGSISAPEPVKPSVGSVARGVVNTARATKEAMEQIVSDAVDAPFLSKGQNAAARAAQLRETQQAQARQAAERPEFDSALGEGLYGAVESTIQQAPGIAASVATGNVAPGLAWAGLTSGTQAYGKYRARGGTPGGAALGGAGEGAVEVLTEMIPMGRFIGAFGKEGGSSFLKEALKSVAADVPGEQIATLAQDAIDTAIANPDKTWGDYLKERPNAALTTLVASVGQGAIMTGGGYAAHRIGQRITPPGIREQAEIDAADSITQADIDSPLDTTDIVAGRAEQAKADAGSAADTALREGGLPAVGKRVVVDLGDGRTETGTMRDVFTADDGSGVVIDLDSGRTMREYNDTLADAGVTIRETSPLDQVLQQNAAGAAETGFDSPAQGDAQQASPLEAVQGRSAAGGDAAPASAAEIDARLAERARLAREQLAATMAKPFVPAPADTTTDAPSSDVKPAATPAGSVDSYMAKTRRAESGGSDTAKNPRSSATGRYQFTDGTWLATYRKEFGDTGESPPQILAKRSDGVVQDRLMRRLTEENAASLKAAGIAITDGNLYLAHFAGEAGARRIIKADPNASIESVLGQDAVNANPFLKGKTAGDVVRWAAGKMGSATGGGETASLAAATADDAANPYAQALEGYKDWYRREARADEAVTTPTERREDAADTVETAGADMRGAPINDDWVKFAADSGTLDIPRSEMPQIKAEHRGAMVNYMNARGIDHAEEIVDPASLKPSQTEFSPAKVQQAKDYEGGNRAILISSDGHIVDGHHQWLAARDRGEEIRAIRLNAPIRDVLAAAHDFPSSTVDQNSTESGESRNTDSAFQASSPKLSEGGVSASPALSETAGGHVAQVDAAPDAPAPVAVSRTGRPAIAAAPQATDTRDVAITTSGREVPVRYAVVSADDLITSHSSDGRINPDFPAALQPRDRARGTSQAQIAEIAAKLDPRLLGRSVKAADGAPIISSDGIVESGNGRTLALLRAYRQGSGRIDAYQKFLRDEGFDTDGIRRPVLVRIREGDMSDADVEAFTREANQRDTAGFSATEQAASDSAALPANVLDLYRGGDIDAAGNREFVRRFIASVVPTTEQAGMIAADGAMSQDAVRRIGAALLQRAYGNANLVARVSEATDSNIKAIGGALSDVSANWAKMVAAAKDGRIDPAMDITEHLNAAVELVDRARREGVKVADLVNQRDIFSGDVVAAHTEAVLRLMFRNQALTQPVSRQKLAAKLSWYVDQAMLSTADAGLFGTAEKTTPDEVIGLAQEKFGEQPSGQDDLLAAARPRDAGDGDGVRQGGRAGERDGEALSREAGDEGRAQSERIEADEPGPAPAPIDDFGEKLEGARKDVWQAYADRLRSAHNEDVQSVPLSKSWPEPDYQKLIDEGADPYVVASMRAMRDAVPTKPRSYGVVAWGKQVEALRAYAEGLLNGSIDAESQRRKLIGEFSRSLRDLQGSIDLYATFGHERSFKGITFGENHYSVYRGERNVTKWAIEQKAKATAFSNWPRELAIGDSREEVLAKFRAALADGVLDPRKRPDVVRFDIYSRRGEPGFWIGKKIGKEYADLKRFDTAKEARDFKISDEGYAELVAALDRFKDIPPERKAVNSPRIGVNHRNGTDVTPEQFSENFGFRGVQFGNYVEGARRQADLNEAYDALMDLAGVLGVPAKALSLNGSLGLAFGARGKGGKNAASAHYETDNIVINLTKKAGAGSLAHEWWHSLDNYFSRMRNDPSSYLTDKPYERGDGVRPEMVQAFKGVMDAIRSTELRQRSSNLDKRRTKAYWSTDIEMSARAFESYVIAKLQDEQFSNDYLANIIPEQSFGIEAGYPYPTAAEVASIRAGFDAFFQTIEARETEAGTALYSIPDLPTVSVRVADWGKLPASGRSRLNVLRGRFIRWYEGLIGTTVTSSDGRPVRFNAAGLKKTMRTGENLLTIGRAIPKIIERGKLVGSEPSRRPGMKAAHRYAANVRDENGNLRAAVVLVREADDGTFHYSLHDYVSEGARDASVETDREAKMAFAPALEGNARDEINLVLLDGDSNADTATDTFDPAALQTRLESYGIARKVALRLVDTLNGPAGSYQDRLIQIATDTAQDGTFTLDHEAIHALRDLGMFNQSEWAIIAAKAKRDPGLMRSIRQRYPKLDAEAQVEEAVADMFARYQRGDYAAEGTVARVFKALRQALEAIGNALAGRGLRSAEGVLGDVAAGRAGQRDANPQANATASSSIPELDMSEEARQARAVKQGFVTEAAWQEMKDAGLQREGLDQAGQAGDDQQGSRQAAGRGSPRAAGPERPAGPDRSRLAVFYHGTKGAIEPGFDLDHPGRKDAGWLGRAVYVTDDPKLANAYASMKRGAGGENVLPLAIRIENPYRASLSDKQALRYLSQEGVDVWTAQIQQAGHDGVVLTYPDGTSEIAVFDPARVRSVFAAFDPDQAGSNELKASIPEAPFERRADGSPDGVSHVRIGALVDSLNGHEKLETIRDHIDDWRVWVQDKMLPVLRAQEATAQALGRDLADAENPYLTEELMTGRAGARLERLSEDIVDPLFAAMHKEGVSIDELETFLYARHAQERNAQIAKINPEFTEGEGSGMTDIEARAVLNRIKKAGRRDTFDALAGYVDRMLSDAMQTRVEAGLLSQEEADAWQATYQHYVPLRGRKEVEGDVSAANDRIRQQSGVTVRGKEGKRAFGRRSEADNILAYSILQAEEAIMRAEKNRAAQAFLKLAQANLDPGFWEVNKIRRVPVMNKTTGLVRYELQSRLAAEDAPYTVTAKVDGDEYHVTMNRDNTRAVKVAEAMRNLEDPKFGKAMALFSSFNRYFSAINTRYNPSFVITNALRDLQTMAVIGQQFDMPGLTRGVLRDYASALTAKKQGSGEWSRWRNEWEMAGGKVYYNQTGDLNQIRKDLQLRAKLAGNPRSAANLWRSTFDAIEAANDSVERAIRLAVYKNAREMGKSPAQAASMSRNITVNFTRRGRLGPVLNSFYAFFNASTQGGANLIMAATKSKKVRAAMAGFIVAGFLTDLLNSMLSGDDDDGESFWDKVPEHEKARNLMLMLPDNEIGQAIKVPLAYGLNALFGLGRNASAVMRGAMSPGEAVLGSGMEFIDAFNPIGGGGSALNLFAPTAPIPWIGDPFIDVHENKDFTGKPIQPEQNPFGSEATPSSNYFPSVSGWAKGIAKGLNTMTGGDDVLPGWASVSPEVIEYLAGYLTGGAGRFVSDFSKIVTSPFDADSEITIRDVPIAKSVFTEKSPWVDKSRFYERIHEVKYVLDKAKDYQEREDSEGLSAYVNANMAVGRMEAATKEASKLMAQVRKARNETSFAREMGQIDDATYRERMDRVKGIEDDVIAAYNGKWVAEVEGAE